MNVDVIKNYNCITCGSPLPEKSNGWVKCNYCGTNHHISENQMLSIKKPTQFTTEPLSKSQLARILLIGLVARLILIKYKRKR